MNKLLLRSKEIFTQAEMDFKPYSVCLAISGGDDSLTAMEVCKALNIKLDFIIHINTRTGIKETANYVRNCATCSSCKYLEGDAGNKYENYVLRKGFFGRGRRAHTFAYHLLKQDQIRSVISKHIRQRKRNRPVLLLNGARKQESENRKHNLVEVYNHDKSQMNNIWINIIHEWSKIECMNFLEDQRVRRNPVSEILHRSGECMCGTMQSKEARQEASFWFPEWGEWIDTLEKRVLEKGFYWKWGDNIPKSFSQKKKGQLDMFDYLPMCQDCLL
jgi:3'-phosphoadenosine 5'-phosphosulfate sulfotransferase (PAPS reductase)/FAD synthetase